MSFLRRACALLRPVRSQRAMCKSSKLGSITYTKQVPNFLAKMGGGGGASDEGIAGALRRRGHEDEVEDLSDAEDEKPQARAHLARRP